MSATIEEDQNLPGFKDFQNLKDFENFCADIRANKVKQVVLHGNGNDIDSVVVIDTLAFAMSKNQSVSIFEIHNYHLGDNGCVRLMDALSHNRNVERLMLIDCKIGDQGAIVVGKFLIENESVRQLGLNKNNIGPSGAQALADGIKQNYTLINFYIAINKLEIEGVRHLLIALTKSASLEQISLINNQIFMPQVSTLIREMGKEEISKKYFWKQHEAGQSLQQAIQMLQAVSQDVIQFVNSQPNLTHVPLVHQNVGAALQNLEHTVVTTRSTQFANSALDELVEGILTDNKNRKITEKANTDAALSTVKIFITELHSDIVLPNVVVNILKMFLLLEYYDEHRAQVTARSDLEEKIQLIEDSPPARISPKYTQYFQDAEQCFESGQFKKATFLYGRARIEATTNLQLATCHTKIGECYMQERGAEVLERFKNLAVAEFRKSIQFLKEIYHDQHPEIIINQSWITQCEGELNWEKASKFDSAHDFINAKKLYLSAADSFLRVDSVGEAASCYANAAICCCKPSINRLDEADNLCQKARNAMQKQVKTNFGIELADSGIEHQNNRLSEIESHIKNLRYNSVYQQGLDELNAGCPDKAILSFNLALAQAMTISQQASCECCIAQCLEDQGDILAARLQCELSYATRLRSQDKDNPETIKLHKKILDEIKAKEKKYLLKKDKEYIKSDIPQETNALVQNLPQTNESSNQDHQPQESKSTGAVAPILISASIEQFKMFYTEGNTAYQEKKFDKATLSFEKALGLSSLTAIQQSNCHLGIARCLRDKNQFKPAMRRYKQSYNTRKKEQAKSHHEMEAIKEEFKECADLKNESIAGSRNIAKLQR